MSKQILNRCKRVVRYISSIPFINHLIRAYNRFDERMGMQLSAGISFFSFLSLIPLLMISFAALGTFLASNPELIEQLSQKIVSNIGDENLATTLKNSVNTAINQRTTVGLTGLALAFYSSIGWMTNLRKAIRFQTRQSMDTLPEDQQSILKHYLWDFISLFGLVLAMVVTIAISSFAISKQIWLVEFFALENNSLLQIILRAFTLLVSVSANFAVFLWLFVSLPSKRPPKTELLKGSLLAAVGFELIKYGMSKFIPMLSLSPSAAVFGSVLTLMMFFYLFAILTLYCSAWIATARLDSND